ncbi:MAG: S8 family serine peptidase [Acidilobaceae archaeon]|nr:S8 family serine peptidase [Acidilobaceae archaeon]
MIELRLAALLLLLLLAIPAAASPDLLPRTQRLEETVSDRFIALGPSAEATRRVVESLGGKVREELGLVNGVAFEGSLAVARRLSSMGYSVIPDRKFQLIKPYQLPMEPALYAGTPTVGAPVAWQLGLNGTGVRVAIIDTGVENRHPWFIRGDRSVVVWEVDATETGEIDYCGYGMYLGGNYHGTHVAGIVASQNETYRGVAPGVDIYDIIAFSREMYCSYTTDSIIVKAIEYALTGPDEKPDSGDEADVLSLSLGFGVTPEMAYAIKLGKIKVASIEALEKAVSKGKVVVIAAGNGWSLNYFNGLCLASGVICVGASSHMGTASPDDDILAFFSSKGPALPGMLVPHVVAPGVYILSAIPVSAYDVESAMISGTSMATPFVSGAAAILIQHLRRHGNVTPQEVMGALMHTAVNVKPQRVDALWLLPDWYKEIIDYYIVEPPVITVADQGAGLIDVGRAVRREIRIHSAGQPFVHLLGSSSSIDLRITNLLDRPILVTVEVSAVEVYTFKNVSALFRPSARELAVEARASATLRVSFENLEPGTYGGYVFLRTQASVYRFPFVVTAPVAVNLEGLRFLRSVELLLPTRDMLDIVTLYVNVREPLPEPFFPTVTTKAGYGAVPALTITSPSGAFSSLFTSSGYLFLERGTYIFSLFMMYSYLVDWENSEISLVLGAPTLTRSVERALQDIQVISARVSLLESALRSLNASLLALRASLEAVRADLNREVEERRREIARIDRAIASLQEAARSLEAGLRAARDDLLALGSNLERANATLAAAIRAEAERITRLEGDARDLQAALRSLAQELQVVEGEVEERRKEIVQLSERHDLTRLLVLLAGLTALAGLVLSGYLFLQKR